MSHKSKSIVTSMVAGIVFLTIYAIYVARPENTPTTLQTWAVTMLVFLAIAVVALIIVQIVFRIVLAAGIVATEGDHDSGHVQRILNSTMAEDEMDRTISLRADRVGYVIAGFGFVAVLVTLAFGAPAVVALHILFGSLAVGSLASGVVSVYGYERGLRHA